MASDNQKKNAVLSFPYEGGLYYLFSRENPSAPPPLRGHPYYEALYGDDPLRSKNDAVNLSILFDEVLLPPADEYLPDHQEHSVGNAYFHPELRVRVSRDWDFVREADEIAKLLMQDAEILKLATALPELPQNPEKFEFLLSRVIGQLRLALQNNAVIIGGPTAGQLVTAVWRLVEHDITEIGAKHPCPTFLPFGEDLFNVTALTWDCKDVDALKAIRTSKEVIEYSDRFRRALFSAASSQDMSKSMRRLMYEAMQNEAISRRAKGALETVGVASTAIGAIPAIGTPAALVGLKSFLAYKQAERKEQSHQWYLLGLKIRELELKSILQEENEG